MLRDICKNMLLHMYKSKRPTADNQAQCIGEYNPTALRYNCTTISHAAANQYAALMTTSITR